MIHPREDVARVKRVGDDDTDMLRGCYEETAAVEFKLHPALLLLSSTYHRLWTAAGAKFAIYNCSVVGMLWQQHVDIWNEPSSFSDTIFLRVSAQQSQLVEKLLTDAAVPHDVVVSDLQKSAYSFRSINIIIS